MPGTLLLPVGMGLLIGLTQLTTWSSDLAPATVALVAVVAAAGLVLRARTLRDRDVDAWAAAAAVCVFAAYLAPIVLSGRVGFAGYVLLGDPSIHLELAERVVHHGATIEGLVPSSYSASLASYFNTSYPTGSHTAFGAVGGLVPVDLAWTYQPYLSWLIALASLAFYELLEPVVRDRRVRALLAFLASQPGLVYAFAMQGAIKELATIATVVTVFALLPWLVRQQGAWRAAIPVAVASAGAVGAIDIAAAAWLGPALVGALVGLWWSTRSTRRLVSSAAAFAVVGAVLAAPALAGLTAFRQGTQAVLTAATEMGNLVRELDWLQVLGIWPRGDFRLPLRAPEPYLLLGVVIAAVLLGVWWLVRRRQVTILGLGAVFLMASWYITRAGSPWADAKALAILSPPILLIALIGAVSLAFGGRRVEAGLLLGLIGGGVLWTNALAYHDVQLSDTPRLRELQRIGEEHAGGGPTFVGEFEEYAKYFLRDAAPTAATEPYKPGPAGTAPGATLRFGFSAPVGDFGAGYLGSFQLLVTRRAPVQSRPPAAFELIERHRFYDVWRRDARLAAELRGELQLGSATQRGGVASCRDVRALSRRGDRLAYVEAPRLPVARPARSQHSPNWYVDGADPETLRAAGPGQVLMPVRVPEAGRYAVWAQASLNRPLDVYVGDRYAGALRAGLSPRGPGEDVYAGDVELPAGPAVVRVRRPGGSLAPGTGGEATLLGPITLVPASTPDPGAVRWTDSTRWGSLCGRHLDWIEAFE